MPILKPPARRKKAIFFRSRRAKGREQRAKFADRTHVASFKDLLVWQKGIELSVETYEVARQLPKTEQFRLASQITSAATSVPSNIAEGYRRNNTAEYRHFCGIALGSAAELETQLIITQRVFPDVNSTVAMGLAVEVQKMLTGLIAKLR